MFLIPIFYRRLDGWNTNAKTSSSLRNIDVHSMNTLLTRILVVAIKIAAEICGY